MSYVATIILPHEDLHVDRAFDSPAAAMFYAHALATEPEVWLEEEPEICAALIEHGPITEPEIAVEAV